MRAATGLDALAAAVGDPDHTEEIIDALLAAASADPAGFRLLFHHAPREPEGGSGAGRRRTGLEDLQGERLRRPGRVRWISRRVPTETNAGANAAASSSGVPPSLPPSRSAYTRRHRLPLVRPRTATAYND